MDYDYNNEQQDKKRSECLGWLYAGVRRHESAVQVGLGHRGHGKGMDGMAALTLASGSGYEAEKIGAGSCHFHEVTVRLRDVAHVAGATRQPDCDGSWALPYPEDRRSMGQNRAGEGAALRLLLPFSIEELRTWRSAMLSRYVAWPSTFTNRLVNIMNGVSPGTTNPQDARCL